MSNGNKGKCPMCSAVIQAPANSAIGDLVYCDQCDAELEIVSLKPLELDWPLDDYEDVDEDDDDFEYEYEDGDYHDEEFDFDEDD